MGTENKISIPARLSKNWVIRLSVLDEYFDIIKDRINENKNSGNYHSIKNSSQHFTKKIQNSII